MKRIKRREFLEMAAAGCLAGTLSNESQAQLQKENAPTGHNPSDSPPSSLEAAAVKVAEAGSGLEEAYFWHNMHTILFLRRVPQQEIYHAVLVDTTTGEKTLPTEFNLKNSPLLQATRVIVSIVGSDHQELHYQPPQAVMSPDGKWLLWSSTGLRKPKWVVASLDGRQYQFKHGGTAANEGNWLPNHPFWMPDGSGWVEAVSQYDNGGYKLTRAYVYSLGHSMPVKTVRIDNLEDGLDVGMTQAGQVMIYHPADFRRDEPVKQAEFSLVSLNSETITPQKLSVPLPIPCRIWDVILSPTGDRLAWILERGDRDKDEHLYNVYISQADGKEMRFIGSAPMVDMGKRYSRPGDLRWLPDGRKISFNYKNGIYVVPV